MFKRLWFAILLLMSLTTSAHAQTGNVYPGSGPLYGSSSATFTALLQGGYQLTTSGGSGGVTDISQTISGATNVAAANTLITTGKLTFSASATVTITAAAAAKTYLTLQICQNGTGGFTPTLVAGSGVTITSCTNAPSIGSGGPFTTTLNQCGNIGLYFQTTTTAYCTGYAAGPL